MRLGRRRLLVTAGAALGTVLAGCNASQPTDTDDAEAEPWATATSTDPAVAAEWNAMRARLWDALALGRSGDTETGATVARGTFARFEEASGERGAHEVLEATSEENYAEFEEALGELRTAGLEPDDLGRAREEAVIADAQLAAAQRELAGEATANALDLQLFGAALADAAFLASADRFEAAETAARDALDRFDEAAVSEALESADADARETFAGAAEATAEAADEGDAEAVRTNARAAFSAAMAGSYSLADDEPAAGAGHVAALQARGWDAAALASAGGPSTAFAHAATLTAYRAHAYDARRLAAAGETDRAAAVAGDVFTHFEEARVHDAFESADGEAYEGFEGGLSDLRSAAESGDLDAVAEAVEAVDSNLVSGTEALAGADAPPLEAAFFRARLADARERYRSGEPDAAASIATSTFDRFERDELGVHEAIESTSEELYARFEDEHLSALIDAYESGDDPAVETHDEGARSALFEFAVAAGRTATVSAGEAAYVTARGFDAAALDAVGVDDRARSVAQGVFEHFESGAGGFHEALESADESLYESFEGRLEAVIAAADAGEEVYPAAVRFDAEAVAAAYAVVEAAGGSDSSAAADPLQATFAHFEEARVHDALEAADRNAYESFEAALDRYVAAVRGDGEVRDAAESFARAAQYAQFALVDGVEELPLDLELAGAGGSESAGGETDLEGGPNVVEGVPDDADHVVDMNAVAFDPAEITVSQGDTVAWRFNAGEPHSVTAFRDGIPDGADYWASGEFDSEEAARTGWENGAGAVQSGESFVRTFETLGTHEYVCIPHEAAGMVGTVAVE
ncbi:DUF5059 domain-containing protein [Halorubrum sp. Boch-26]|uniref:DUF5059 domain-containing protein n=1 Tax=Halorubrum sp. Boch-26 TaxID=2994426 RepID=UPI002468D02B|nr:DUF5059 domain-containing protein [Halorubrum sp. Boch-26]